jgi:hypothetical protein
LPNKKHKQQKARHKKKKRINAIRYLPAAHMLEEERARERNMEIKMKSKSTFGLSLSFFFCTLGQGRRKHQPQATTSKEITNERSKEEGWAHPAPRRTLTDLHTRK